MRTLLLGSFLLSSSAVAGGFDDVDTPITTTFNFAWTGYTPGATTFTFAAPTSTSSTTVCDEFGTTTGTEWCLNGDFSTGNGGIGDYSTRLFRQDCTTTTVTTFLIFQTRTQACDVDERLRATYSYTTGVVNPAVYEGYAQVGTADRTRDRVFNIFAWSWGPWSDWTDFDYNQSIPPGEFEGALSGPGSGIFCESPLTC